MGGRAGLGFPTRRREVEAAPRGGLAKSRQAALNRLMRKFVLISVAAVASAMSAVSAGRAAAASPGRGTSLSIVGGRWHLNGRITYPGADAEGLLLNVRMVNATFEDRRRQDFDPDANVSRFLERLADYAAHGVRAVTLNLQGGMPGYEGALNSAFNPDGSLRSEYLRRVRRVIEACDHLGVAVILGCFYQRQDQTLRDAAAVRAGVVNAARWIRRQGWRHAALEIANEWGHPGFDHDLLRRPEGQVELIRLARRAAPDLLVSTSGLGDGRMNEAVARAVDFILIHFNGTPVGEIPRRVRALKRYGKPIVCNEDDKTGAEGAAALRACAANGASWGFMHKRLNQYRPFEFRGAADDPAVYAAMKELASTRRLARRARGPLRRHPDNPRYFADDLGRTVFLTGSHTWNNFQDILTEKDGRPFDYNAWLDFMVRHGHNFMRLWRWELLKWDTKANRQAQPRLLRAPLQPWARTGPGRALDGGPKFDLRRFNEAYFRRLRERVRAAGERGVYTAVMLFEGWGMQFVPGAWEAHPFHPANNVNGLNPDANGDGRGLEIYELELPKALAFQEAYVRKVIDTVNDFDNVLYEISNENHPASTAWQYHMIRFIREYERSKPKQHPVGMTFQYRGGSNETLFRSPADWISPNPQAPSGFNYRYNPPPADGRKVILADTDHLWGVGGNAAWAWKSFLRGLNPIFMDPYDGSVLRPGKDAEWERIRRALGAVRRLCRDVDPAALTPRPDLAGGGFCLADPGYVYLAWVPKGKSVRLDLSEARGFLKAVWVDPIRGARRTGRPLKGGGMREIRSDRDADVVLWLQWMKED